MLINFRSALVLFLALFRLFADTLAASLSGSVVFFSALTPSLPLPFSSTSFPHRYASLLRAMVDRTYAAWRKAIIAQLYHVVFLSLVWMGPSLCEWVLLQMQDHVWPIQYPNLRLRLV